MNELRKYINGLSDGHTAVSLDEVEAIRRRYPFFVLPAAQLLAGPGGAGVDSETRSALLAALAINAPARSSMLKMLDADARHFIDFYPLPQVVKKSTDDTIDTFLNTYGHTSPREDELLERLIFNPQPEYAQMLEAEADMPGAPAAGDDPQLDAINAFIARDTDSRRAAAVAAPAPSSEPEAVPEQQPEPASTPAPAVAPAPMPAPQSGSLTESLAHIYIRQQKFEKAYEIISGLQQSHPDLNKYYSDQLRFLRKAIAARGGKV